MPVVTRTAGDCHSRFEVLLDQVYVSLDLAEQCLDRVDRITGPVNVRLPKVVKAPEGHTYAWTENPLGINGYYLVSRGEKTPWRLKLRTASYANVQALATLHPGLPGAGPDRDPRLDVLRRRRHRQVAKKRFAPAANRNSPPLPARRPQAVPESRERSDRAQRSPTGRPKSAKAARAERAP